MPRPRKPSQNGGEEADEPTANESVPSSGSTETPAHLLQSWVKDMYRDAQRTGGDDNDDDGDNADSSEWDTDESDDDGDGVLVRGKNNTVSITYIVGVPTIGRESDDTDEDPEGSVDGEEQSAPSESEMSEDDMDPEELAEVANVIA